MDNLLFQKLAIDFYYRTGIIVKFAYDPFAMLYSFRFDKGKQHHIQQVQDHKFTEADVLNIFDLGENEISKLENEN